MKRFVTNTGQVSLLLATAAVTFLTAACAYGQDLQPTRPVRNAVGITIGTLGLGVDGVRMLNDRVGVRAVAGYAGIGFGFQSEDLHYDASVKLRSLGILANLYPFPTRGFHMTTGLIFSNSRLEGNLESFVDGTVKIHGNEYTSEEVGRMQALADLPNVQPYVGVGFWRPVKHGVNLVFMADLGVGIGSTNVSIDATGARTNPSLASDLDAQERSTQRTLDRTPLWPVLTTGLYYAF